MPIDPVIQKGHEAYRSGRYHEAHTAWERAAARVSGDRRGLLSALADLAGALEREDLGREQPAADLLDDLRGRLDRLPDQVLGVDVDRLRAALPEDPAEVLAAPPEIAAARPVPRWVLWRFVLFVVLVGTGFAVLRFTPLGERFDALLDRERLVALREGLRAKWWTGPALVGAYSVLAPLGAPVSPLMLAGGAIFGAVKGAILNILGTFLGAAGSFFLARWLGRDFVVHVMGERLQRVVNYGAALAGVPAALFLVATGLGLIPANVVYTYFASALFDAVGGDRAQVFLQMGVAVAGLLTLSFLPNVLEARRRKRRYRELRAHRRQLGR